MLLRLFFPLIFIFCSRIEEFPVYTVKNINSASVIIDGISKDRAWEKAKILDDFLLPWDDKIPQQTKFRALYDRNNLYILFQAEDLNLIIKDTITKELDITEEDRLELYFSKDITMEDYYCLEIDPLGRILDYQASFYRNFNNHWNINRIQIAGNIFKEAYQLEIAIPVNCINEMGIDISEDFYIGLFRADLEDSSSVIKENWISWRDPQSPEPDYHIPEALGLIRFEICPVKEISGISP